MELNDLLTSEAHEEGAEIRIKNPNTGEDTDIYIKVLGPDSIESQRIVRRERSKIIAAMSKSENIEDVEIESEINQAVAVTIGWRGMTEGGKEFKFTPARCRKLYKDSPGVRDQIERYHNNRKNFTKG